MSVQQPSFDTTRSENTRRFYERMLAEGLKCESSDWSKNKAKHNFALAFGQGINFRKVFFFVESQNIERFVHLAFECNIGDELIDLNTTSSVNADAFPSLRCDSLAWHLREEEIPSFPAQVTLREFLRARQYDVPVTYDVADELAQELFRRGIAIPFAVAELELARVNFNRKQETEPYILEENVSQHMQRAYGSNPKNSDGKPCNALTASKKKKLYAKRFMYRFTIGTGIYLPASPERVMAMVSVLTEMAADGMDLSFLGQSDSQFVTSHPLSHFLHCTVTDFQAAIKFPSQDVHCLKWQQSSVDATNTSEGKMSLGWWLELQNYFEGDAAIAWR